MKVELRELAWRRASPLSTALGRWQERKSLLVRLIDEHQRVGHGEAAPLPGYSSDTLEEAERALEGVDLLAIAALAAAGSWDTAELELPPAARFALESALLELGALEAGVPAWRLLADAAGGAVSHRQELSRLVDARDAGGVVAAGKAAWSARRRTIKLKLSPEALEAQLEGVARLRQALPELRVRLDANRCLSLARARWLVERAAELRVEYVEEPIGDPAELPSLAGAAPIALDESLQGLGARDRLEPLLAGGAVRILVLKPMALGGIQRCTELWRLARRHGSDVVLSHLLDGPVAFAATAALSLAIGAPERAAGLDTPPLAESFGVTAPSVSEGLRPWQAPGFGLTHRDDE